jgi:hypothetical protein
MTGIGPVVVRCPRVRDRRARLRAHSLFVGDFAVLRAALSRKPHRRGACFPSRCAIDFGPGGDPPFCDIRKSRPRSGWPRVAGFFQVSFHAADSFPSRYYVRTRRDRRHGCGLGVRAARAGHNWSFGFGSYDGREDDRHVGKAGRARSRPSH